MAPPAYPATPPISRPKSIAPRAATAATPSDVRAPNSSAAEHVAAVAVPAEQQQRGAGVARRPHEVTAGQPRERHAVRQVGFVCLFELIDQPPGVDERRVPAAALIDDVRPRGRHVQQAAEMIVHCVRRQNGRANGRQQREGDEHDAKAASDGHDASGIQRRSRSVIGAHGDPPGRAPRPTAACRTPGTRRRRPRSRPPDRRRARAAHRASACRGRATP